MTSPTRAELRSGFLNLAALVEGIVCAAAFGLGWLAGIDPTEHLHFTWRAVGTGLLALVPMFALLALALFAKAPPLVRIRDFVQEILGPPLAACRWYDLILLALLAGTCEELLFRGVLQPWTEAWGATAGLVGSNLVFGLLHAVTPTYALATTALGLVLGWSLDAGGDRQLLAPLLAHAVYDYVAFLWVVREQRRIEAGAGPRVEDGE